MIQTESERLEYAMVSGERMERTIGAFRAACLRHIGEQLCEAAPNTPLIATLCDAVRLTREHVAHLNGSIVDRIQAYEGARADAVYGGLIGEIRQIAETGTLPAWTPEYVSLSDSRRSVVEFCRAAVKRIQE